MKVLFVNITDVRGGAGKAAYRLHRGLIHKGVKSNMIVKKKFTNDPSVKTPNHSDISFILDRVKSKINSAYLQLQKSTNSGSHSTSLFSSGLHKIINTSDADIVHLHWIGGKMITIKEVSKISKPIVWTLHDMWAFSGAEHYDDLTNPGRYKEGYLKENRPNSHKGVDIDRWTWNKKLKYWREVDFNIVTPSKWLATCVSQSKLFSDKNTKVIPNGIDLSIYKPIPDIWAKKIFNIPSESDNTRYILFGAMSATMDQRKGYKQLMKSLEYLKNRDNNYRLLIFGSDGYDDVDFGLPTTYLGTLNDDETLAMAYSAVDVMVVPSLQDNLPNTALEAFACGTPVVAFDIGGLPDIIDHKENGFLVKPFDNKELAEGVKWVIDNEVRNNDLSTNARQKAVDQFEIGKVANNYLELYKKVLTSS